MLLLVTLGLIVASAVLLIVGFVQDTLGFIYVSMLCAGVAAVALFVFARLAKRHGDTLLGAQVAGAEEAAATPAPTAADRAGGQPDRSSAEEDDPWAEVPSVESAAADDGVFPIADYDDLRAAEILPLLSRLDADGLQDVRDRELAGKARATVLDRIDDRLARRGAPMARGRAEAPPFTEAEAGDPNEKAAKKASARRAPAKKAAAATGGEAPLGPAPKAAKPAAGPPAGQPVASKKATGKQPGTKAAAKPATGKTAAKSAAAKEAPGKEVPGKEAPGQEVPGQEAPGQPASPGPDPDPGG